MRHEPTDAERVLWRHLRHLDVAGSHFRRQATIGQYFADFACHAARLVIELDGGQHNEVAGLARDAKRTADLEARGYRVLRFWNNDVVANVEGVTETIATAVRDDDPPTPPRHALHGGRWAQAAPPFVQDTLLQDTLLQDTLVQDTFVQDTLIQDSLVRAKRDE